mgnify:FL=1
MAQNYGKNIFGYDLGDPNKPDEPDFYDPSVGIDEMDQYNKEIANYMANNSIGKQPGVRTGIQNPLNIPLDTTEDSTQLDELMSPEGSNVTSASNFLPDLNAGTLPIEVTKAALPDIVKDPGPKTEPSPSNIISSANKNERFPPKPSSSLIDMLMSFLNPNDIPLR